LKPNLHVKEPFLLNAALVTCTIHNFRGDIEEKYVFQRYVILGSFLGFLGEFAKKKKPAKSTDWLRRVRLCVRVYQLGCSWTDFRGIAYWETSTKI
jgi:hypothetical protein